MYRGGQTINPRSVRFTERAQLSGADLANFRGRLRSLLATPLGAARATPGPAQATTAQAAP
jgi:hypothetical protein